MGLVLWFRSGGNHRIFFDKYVSDVQRHNGPETSPIKWYDHNPIKFQQTIDYYEAKQQGHQEFSMWDSSSEGSCRQNTTARRKDRRPLTAKELEIFDKETEEFFKTYKSPTGSDSG